MRLSKNLGHEKYEFQILFPSPFAQDGLRFLGSSKMVEICMIPLYLTVYSFRQNTFVTRLLDIMCYPSNVSERRPNPTFRYLFHNISESKLPSYSDIGSQLLPSRSYQGQSDVRHPFPSGRQVGPNHLHRLGGVNRRANAARIESDIPLIGNLGIVERDLRSNHVTILRTNGSCQRKRAMNHQCKQRE